ncbi:MAG: RNA pseudouridine synthase [bacterium]|nr:RNA pseudouridine synthase [bacterium]
MKKLHIIYEDKNIIVVDKPAKLLTIASAKEKYKTLYKEVSDYLKKKHASNKVYIVHRLDYETSGVILFAKNHKYKTIIQNNWNNIVINREYQAIVEGIVTNKEQTIKSYLKETKTHLSYSTTDKQNGKLAITKYKVIKQNNKYSLLQINILTGRKNQIRVHMQDINHPIIGDKKYHSKENPLNRLGLHACLLEINIKGYKETFVFKSNPPKAFLNLFKDN